jgi:PPOX class probable F420-dependent enzyme
MSIELDAKQRAFLEKNRSAAMTTLRPDGTPHAVRVGVALVEGRLWSSGTQKRTRTAHLRRDSRATLFVFDAQWQWLTLECQVRFLEGADAPELNLRFFKLIQQSASGRLSWFGRDVSEEEFLQIMRDEQRLIYEFDVQRAYGMFGEMPGAS